MKLSGKQDIEEEVKKVFYNGIKKFPLLLYLADKGIMNFRAKLNYNIISMEIGLMIPDHHELPEIIVRVDMQQYINNKDCIVAESIFFLEQLLTYSTE